MHTTTVLIHEGKTISRVRYGDEKEDWGADRQPCHDCAVLKGEFYRVGCDAERCPVCDGQFFGCECEFEEPLPGASRLCVMPPEPEVAVGYEPPQPPRPSGALATFAGFLGGWIVGVLLTDILSNIITQSLRGHHHDGGMSCLAVYSVVLEAPVLAGLRGIYGPARVGPLFAFLFGVSCGPALVIAMIGVALIA